jgi:predicted component of type VI protein secretion system
MSTNTKKTKKTRPICLPIQKDKENQTDMSTNTKRQRKPDRYVYQYKKDKENQTDMSTNTKRQRKPDRYVYQYKKTKKTRPICLPIGDIGGVKDDMKEYSDQFLKSNPQNNTVEENWTNFKVTLRERPFNLKGRGRLWFLSKKIF